MNDHFRFVAKPSLSYITLFLLVFCFSVIKTHAQCPTPDYAGWTQGNKVYYTLDSSIPPDSSTSTERSQIQTAINIWNVANVTGSFPNNSRVEFVPGPPPAGTLDPSTLLFKNGPIASPGKAAQMQPIVITGNGLNIPSNRIMSAEITFDTTKPVFVPGTAGSNTIFVKYTLHEIGHSLGLSDAPLGSNNDICSQPDQESVMNQACGYNDSSDNMPQDVENCDTNAINSGYPPQPPPEGCSNPYENFTHASCGNGFSSDFSGNYCCQRIMGTAPGGGICAMSMQNFARGACPYGYSPDSTGYYCCRTGCPIQDCSEEQADCENNGGIWKGCCTGCFSPIVIDVAGNGFNLTDGNNGVDLDLLGTGTKDKVAWTAPGSDDAWLALDRNHNGTIDNALELFGNFTEQPQSIPVKDRNGFLALAVFDQPQNGGNGDGKINRQDRVFADLRLWQDTNHNGISEPNELHTLDSLDVRALLLDFKETKRTDQYGNRFKYRARVRDSRDADVGKFAWDVFPVKPR